MDEWTNKRWCVHIHTQLLKYDNYSALTRKNTLAHAKRMNPEDMRLSKRVSHVRTNTVGFHLLRYLD